MQVNYYRKPWTVTPTEWVLLACNVIMLSMVAFSLGIAKEAHEAMIAATKNRIVIGVPATDRTNHAQHYEATH